MIWLLRLFDVLFSVFNTGDFVKTVMGQHENESPDPIESVHFDQNRDSAERLDSPDYPLSDHYREDI